MSSKLYNINVYKDSRNISKEGRNIYKNMNRKEQKIIGDQFIRAIDSIGANIAEGYGRYHDLDSIRFYYYARGSLIEGIHRTDLLLERNYITKEIYDYISKNLNQLGIKSVVSK